VPTAEPKEGVKVVRRRLRVTGRVQGVWFRESCREVADRLGVAGSVRNRADGTVEVVVEEEPEGLVGFRVS
jgi:acylphosphatase